MIGLLLPLWLNLESGGPAPPANHVIARGSAKALPLVTSATADVLPLVTATCDVQPLTVLGTADVVK